MNVCWVDGKVVYEAKDVEWRTKEEALLETLMLHFYHGALSDS